MAACKPLYFFLLLCFPALLAQAQSDSSQTRLREVEVTTSRVRSFSAGSRALEASPVAIQLKQQAPLPELLRQMAPVYVKNYGPGNLASLSVRGTSANQSALVWNGIQINAATNGLTDLNLIQTGAVQTVKLVPGPMSALYGSGAMGGTLFLDAQPSADSVKSFRIRQSIGSFSAYQTRVQGTYGSRNWQGRSSFSYGSARNDFPFTNTFLLGKPVQRTVNARQYQHNFTQDLFFSSSGRYSVALHAWHYQTHRQIPPVLSVPRSRAEQYDKASRLAAVVKRRSALGTTTFRAGYLSDYLLYLNPQVYTTPPAPARTTTLLTEVEQQLLLKNYFVNAGLSVRTTFGRVEEYGKPVEQSQLALFVSGRRSFASGTTIALNARKEFVEGYDPDPTASVGAEQVLGRFTGVKLKAQVANSFRVPTLNERYWNPGGNPNLKPEKGFSAEAGLAWQPLNENHPIRNIEVTAYNSHITDMILWKQVSAFVFSPENINQVWARGAEASLEMQQQLLAKGKVQGKIRASYAYTRSTQLNPEEGSFENKQLIYIPEHNASLFASLESRNVNIGWQQAWQGAVFTSADNLEKMPGFALSDLLIWSPEFGFRRLRFEVQGTVRNLFNQTYQVIRNTPMPGRSYELSLQLIIPYSTQTHVHKNE